MSLLARTLNALRVKWKLPANEHPLSTAARCLIDLAGNLVLDGQNPTRLPLVPYTESHTLTGADIGKYLRMNSGSGINLTVPADTASDPIEIGSQVVICNSGAGQVTVVADSGVTINTAQTLLLRAQHSTATLIKVGANEWDLAGDLEAA